ANVSAGNRNMAKTNSGLSRVRMAYRIVLMFALLAFVASMFSGHSAILDILANILLAASIVLLITANGGFYFLRHFKKRLAISLKRRGRVFAVRPSIGKALANDTSR